MVLYSPGWQLGSWCRTLEGLFWSGFSLSGERESDWVRSLSRACEFWNSRSAASCLCVCFLVGIWCVAFFGLLVVVIEDESNDITLCHWRMYWHTSTFKWCLPILKLSPWWLDISTQCSAWPVVVAILMILLCAIDVRMYWHTSTFKWCLPILKLSPWWLDISTQSLA